MGYRLLKGRRFQYQGYELVSLRKQDIALIKKWRNDQISILRQQKPLTDDEQIKYFQEVVMPSFGQRTPKIVLLSFLREGRCIGYGGLVHIDWESGRAEVSFLLETEIGENERIASRVYDIFLHIIIEIAFQHLSLRRLTTETFDVPGRGFIYEGLKSNGFVEEGVFRQHIYKQGDWRDAYLHGLLKDDCARNNSLKQLKGNILITSLSKKISLINAVKTAVKRLDNAVHVWGADIERDCVGRYFVDDFWQMPPLVELGRQGLLDFCEQYNICYIIPTRDGELAFWAGIKNYFSEKGIEVFVPSAESLKLCLDKLLFYQTLLLARLPVIPTSESFLTLRDGLFVVKERYGSSERRLGVGLGLEAAKIYANKLSHPLYQEYVCGREWSADVYRTKEGLIKGVIMRWRNQVKEGESQVTTTFYDPNLEHILIKAVRVLNIQGHAVFQGFMTADREVALMEVNARFGGASALSLAMGLDSFYWWLLECMGNDLSAVSYVSSYETKQLIRYPADKIEVL